jgi:Ca-activated chloride channel homolog
MEWHHPEYLYLILPLTVAWLVLKIFSERRRRLARQAFVAEAMWTRILPEESAVRFWAKLLLQEAAIILGLMALAGPRFGTQTEQVIPRGSDLYVLIDVSRSMLADDVPPSRLGRAKADVGALVNQLEGERIGLIAFAGQAVVKCPLTVDYDSFRRALQELDPDSAPRGGTAIGDAVRKALEVFHGKAERDQAVLLITDGDDQESYPMEAAALAAERKVTIFAVGLGDAEQGARVPQKSDARSDSKSYVEYAGEQVWSKLQSTLLQDMALKTSGVYVPAGTRTYDLGELYASHLRGRKGSDGTTVQRVRRSEQFQIFLSLALVALLIDLSIGRYRRTGPELPEAHGSSIQNSESKSLDNPKNADVKIRRTKDLAATAVLLLVIHALCGSMVQAAESKKQIREGLQLYADEKFDEAGKKFAAAGAELIKEKSAAAATAAFDEACAQHRLGKRESARSLYLEAGLSQDRALATAAHFNLGMLAAEQARSLAGEQPVSVSVEKRQEILDELQQAVVAWRHCLELQPDHRQARHNLELVRQWVKYYNDQWRERDREERRRQLNFLQFTEYLIQAQTGLRETVSLLPQNTRADTFAELKQAQSELAEEIPFLIEKIDEDLRSQSAPSQPAPGQPAPGQLAPLSAEEAKQLEESISMLQKWAEESETQMRSAVSSLQARKPEDVITKQQAAIGELDRIWDAVIPFRPLLDRELQEQTSMARMLSSGEEAGSAEESAFENSNEDTTQLPPASASESAASPTPALPSPASPSPASPSQSPVAQDPATLQIADEDFEKLRESQDRILRKARLLKPKAEAELSDLENQTAEQSQPSAVPVSPDQEVVTPEDTEKQKEGLRRAIELAPRAVDEMQLATESLQSRDREKSFLHAEEARRILEEIQKSQPENKSGKISRTRRIRTNRIRTNRIRISSRNSKRTSSQKRMRISKRRIRISRISKNRISKRQIRRSRTTQRKRRTILRRIATATQQQQQRVSADRIEEALRRVRERQQEKQERDRVMRRRVPGRAPVEKDW